MRNNVEEEEEEEEEDGGFSGVGEPGGVSTVLSCVKRYGGGAEQGPLVEMGSRAGVQGLLLELLWELESGCSLRGGRPLEVSTTAAILRAAYV